MKEFGRSLEGVWQEFGRSLEGVWTRFGISLEGVWKEFGRSSEGVWKELEGVKTRFGMSWTRYILLVCFALYCDHCDRISKV